MLMRSLIRPLISYYHSHVINILDGLFTIMFVVHAKRKSTWLECSQSCSWPEKVHHSSLLVFDGELVPKGLHLSPDCSVQFSSKDCLLLLCVWTEEKWYIFQDIEIKDQILNPFQKQMTVGQPCLLLNVNFVTPKMLHRSKHAKCVMLPNHAKPQIRKTNIPPNSSNGQN